MAAGTGELGSDDGPLWQRISAAAVAGDSERAKRGLADLDQKIAALGVEPDLAAIVAREPVRALLAGVFAGSPFLTELSLRDPERLLRCLARDPDQHFSALKQQLRRDVAAATGPQDVMRLLRLFKSEAALLIALADIAGVWPVMHVTGAITATADTALQCSIRYLLGRAAESGSYFPTDLQQPEDNSGYIVLAMGKHGAGELNYSSDIDLIVFFERGQARLKEGLDPQQFFVRITRDLVRFMQERTADGYVFRTDLRLRPDPGSTQIALSTAAALHYYESFGQNWERAALIKARPAAGDLVAGRSLLKELEPYIWRKYLDFAAIADVHAMKRQIHAVRGFGELRVDGHNIKLGRGGIREIEFFAQTQQLIAGGRQQELRTPRTLEALDLLAARGWITRKAVDDLEPAYKFLRMVEHRLQMVADEQTQTLPDDPAKLAQISRFCGFATVAEFRETLTGHLERVQKHYAALFEEVPELTSAGGNLVFTGSNDDPGTVATLERMGYRNPSSVLTTVRGWHFGRYHATSNARARERLTEFQPVLLEALAGTADPDAALAAFDRFLAALPAGVQLFSLLRSNPSLLRLLADIMGSAPRLAQVLGRRRRLLDVVLDPGFFGTLPSEDELDALVDGELADLHDFQDILDRARVIGNEQAFLIGVRVLSQTISGDRAGLAYGRLAEHLIARMHQAVDDELGRSHGHAAEGASCVIAMGKLGGREMTAASDLDLIIVYDFDRECAQTNGRRPLSGSQYFARMTQRLISALAAPTAEGTLYEVDMRLRPSGNSGPVATHIDGFVDYQANQAWTWEHMALTRARVISGPAGLSARLEATIRDVLCRRRDREKIAAEVVEMRQRIFNEKGTTAIWDLKQVRGGLVDLEFATQYLQLIHAADHPGVLDQNTTAALGKLAEAGCLSPADAEILLPAARFYQNMTQALRLCFAGVFEPEKAPDGLKRLLANVGECPDFERLELQLTETLGAVHACFEKIVR